MGILHSERNSQESILILYQKDNPITGANALGILQKEKDEREKGNPVIDFTLWGIQEKQEIKSHELGKTAIGSIFNITGDASLLFYYEGFLSQNDREGCLISKNLAYRLFGSSNVAGIAIEAAGRTWIIRGILQEAKDTVVINATDNTEKIIDSAVIRIPKNLQDATVIASFRHRHGFGEDIAMVNIFKDMSELAVTLIVICMGFGLFIPWGKVLYRKRKLIDRILERTLFYFLLSGSIVFFMLYVYVGNISIRIPEDFFPAQWSDFYFFRMLFTEKREEILALFTMEMREPEQILIISFLHTMKYCFLSLGIYFIFIRGVKIDTARTLYVYVFSSVCFTFYFIYLNRESGQTLAGDRRFWLLLPLYFVGVYILYIVHSSEFSCNKLFEVHSTAKVRIHEDT